jgi:response regulator RpfG family c-di-GMP phosphodiesterase
MEIKTHPPQSISILCVEDDGDILELLSSILAVQYPDFTLYTAINGRLGLEHFKAHMSEIVITDINMSEMCGVQMSKNIRAIKPETKIIAITGKSGEPSINEECIMHNSDVKVADVDHVIVKPVDISELCGVIEICLGEINEQN